MNVKFIIIAALVLFIGGELAFAQSNSSSCANCNPCSSPTSGSCSNSPTCPTGGTNQFDIFSADIYRNLEDLALPVEVGEHPMKFGRVMTSRPEWAVQTRHDFPFGRGANWRHSLQWSILDDGQTDFGSQKIEIIYPNSVVAYYYKKSSNDLHMTYLPKTQERILQEGTNYFLFHMDGTRYHITERPGVTTGKLFRLEGYWDAYSNYYAYVYDSNDLVTAFYGPNTNHFFHIEYARVTNAVDVGLIEFSYVNTNAAEVLLAGDFNGWEGVENPMSLTAGVWRAYVNLTNGFYEYKFVVRLNGQTNFSFIRDPENPMYGGTFSNSVAVVDPYRVIARVEASDGRSVTYRYDWSYNGSPENLVDILLVSAEYDDGTSGQYTYYSGYGAVESRALLKTAEDPYVKGAARAMQYTYHTNLAYAGMIHEEYSLITSQLFGRLEFDPSNQNIRIYTDAAGQTTRYDYVENTCNLSSRTNAVGYVNSYVFYADGEGMLWKEIDPLGRTTVYTRTWHFGAVLSISNSTSSCGCEADVVNTYTDETYPFYLASQTKKGDLTTAWTRDEKHRPVRIDYPDGTYETNAYNEFGQLLAQRKRDGSLWTWSYDERGRKITETDPLNYTTHYGYGVYDRLALVSNALGYVTRYFYNWRGLVTNVVYADGTEEKTWYDVAGAVTQRQDRAGGHTVHRYDALGQLSEVIDPVGATNRYFYNSSGQLVTQTSPLGLTVSNTYDAIGRKIREAFSSDGSYNEWHYDPDGVRTQIDRLGGATLVEYNDDRKIAAQRDPNGNWTRFGYDVAGNRTHVTNALNDVTEYTYDAVGRPTSMRDCEGSVVSNVYDGLGRLIRQIDANSIVASNAYDAVGRLVSTWRGSLLLVSNGYNAVGWPVSRQDANGLVITNTYNAVGRVLRMYMPDGSYSENVYSNTYLVQTIDRALRSTFYQLDVLGQVTNQIDNATNTVRYGYDAIGNLTGLYDQNGNHTRFLFDVEGRQIGKVYADGVTNQYSYDALGRLTNKIDGKGVSTAYRYDSVGNLTNIDYAADADVFFAYDALSRMMEMVDGVGTTLYAYAGSCGKVQSVDGPFENDTVSYGYDAGKRLVAITSEASVVHYSFDALDRIISVVSGGKTNAYTYVANGRLVDSLSSGNGVVSEYSYDPLNRLTNLVHQSGGTNFASFAYTYNAADLRTSVTLGDAPPSSRTISYGYDSIGQLTSAQGDFPGYNFDYNYDPAGNPTRQNNNGFVMSNAFNSLNQNTTSQWSGALTVLGLANPTDGEVEVNGITAALRSAGDQIFFVATNLPVVSGTNTYTAIHTDPLSRAATSTVSAVARNKGYGYDANGNMTNDGQFVYVWDNADRLKEVRKDGEVVMTCRYDGLGRRRERIVAAHDGGGASTNWYVYNDGWLVLEVRDDGNNVLESYTHGPDLSGTLGGAGGIGGILHVAPLPGGIGGGYFHYDANGNVVRLTSADRIIVSAIEYGPFGTVLLQSGSYTSRYQFSSKEFDSAVGLNYYGFRYYATKTGRWLSRDPIEESGGYNLYWFVNNSPLDQFDPLGLRVSGTECAAFANAWVTAVAQIYTSTNYFTYAHGSHFIHSVVESVSPIGTPNCVSGNYPGNCQSQCTQTKRYTYRDVCSANAHLDLYEGHPYINYIRSLDFSNSYQDDETWEEERVETWYANCCPDDSA